MPQTGRTHQNVAETGLPDRAGPPDTGGAELARHERREFISLMATRVREAHLHKPYFADGATDLVSLCREMSRLGLNEALIRDGDRVGIFTTTDLRDALLRPVPPAELAVREIAHFDPLSVSPDDALFDALILMLRHRFHRLLVRQDDHVIGILRQLDLMAFLASHSQLIALQAAHAPDIPELGAAARSIDGLIRAMSEDGVRVDVIAGLVGGLNRQVFQRLWELVAPDEVRANSCLIVMGSEGRNEQIVKTDQDNALLLRDGFTHDGLDAITAAFTAALLEFGYPLCKGGIMLSRPLWCQPVEGFRRTITDWIHGSDPEGPMNLAIFLDAAVVTGDASLLAEARAHVDRILTGSDAYYARFAAAVDQFGSGEGGWWRRLPGLRGREAAEIDLKKLGIFPIVHGVRTLALQYRVDKISTVERLAALAEAERLDRALAQDLTEALRFLMGLKLSNNLKQIKAGRAPDNAIALAEVGTLDRQALKDSLAIVRRFRDWLGTHYRLDSL